MTTENNYDSEKTKLEIFVNFKIKSYLKRVAEAKNEPYINIINGAKELLKEIEELNNLH